jgi:hypothetical protein
MWMWVEREAWGMWG